MKERQMMQLYTDTRPSSSNTMRVLIRPSFLTTRKVGIRPPPNHMVNTIKKVISPWPYISLRESE